ncbi:hypothetical protein [Texcoconibacillus texcoconensis]|uniref:tRNA(Ile)-lysidine synthase TilS/MesJ n=1 Tax=Texcoconibacillus texcoconensis TaxID=1095777 RepID=A0A840QN03_9BACI|nr:hypothetical protein [Texcoconibacillus texcoconensis]MBB5172738.1 tRNA(Ile)-lysidine synthase TilS/MesJ [Texcoconibacillus texcoconensis]
MGTFLYSSFATFIFLLIAMTGCQNDSPPIKEQFEENEEVEIIFDNEIEDLNFEDYRNITEEANEYLNDENIDDPDIRRWFIREKISHLQNRIQKTNENILEDAKERFKYEIAWRELAEKRYHIHASETSIKEQIEYNLALFGDEMPETIIGMAEGLDMTVEEFMSEFDRDHAERSVIWQKLMPLLMEKYQQTTDEVVESFQLGQLYEQEVYDYLEEEEEEAEE